MRVKTSEGSWGLFKFMKLKVPLLAQYRVLRLS